MQILHLSSSSFNHSGLPECFSWSGWSVGQVGLVVQVVHVVHVGQVGQVVQGVQVVQAGSPSGPGVPGSPGRQFGPGGQGCQKKPLRKWGFPPPLDQSPQPTQNFCKNSEFLSFFVLYSRLLADFLSHLGKWVKLIKFEAENEFFCTWKVEKPQSTTSTP